LSLSSNTDWKVEDGFNAGLPVGWLLARHEHWRRAGKHAVDHAEPALGMAARGREDRRDGQASAGARGLVRPRVCGGRPRRHRGEVAGCEGGPGTRG